MTIDDAYNILLVHPDVLKFFVQEQIGMWTKKVRELTGFGRAADPFHRYRVLVYNKDEKHMGDHTDRTLELALKTACDQARISLQLQPTKTT